MKKKTPRICTFSNWGIRGKKYAGVTYGGAKYASAKYAGAKYADAKNADVFIRRC